MGLAHTRSMVRAILEGALAEVETDEDPVFGLAIPVRVPGVPDEVLRPRGTWEDPDAYDRQARKLAEMFRANFEKYEERVREEVSGAGP